MSRRSPGRYTIWHVGLDPRPLLSYLTSPSSLPLTYKKNQSLSLFFYLTQAFLQFWPIMLGVLWGHREDYWDEWLVFTWIARISWTVQSVPDLWLAVTYTACTVVTREVLNLVHTYQGKRTCWLVVETTNIYNVSLECNWSISIWIDCLIHLRHLMWVSQS